MKIPFIQPRFIALTVFTVCLLGLIVLYIVDPDVPRQSATTPPTTPPTTEQGIK